MLLMDLISKESLMRLIRTAPLLLPILTCLFVGNLNCSAVQAQANLLLNGDFQNPGAPVIFFYDNNTNNTGTASDILGWLAFANPDESSWVQISRESESSANWILDLSGSDLTAPGFVGLAGIQTADSARPRVTPLETYKATVTYDNYFEPAGISYFIDWFNAGGGLISSVGGRLSDPNGPGNYEPLTQVMEITGSAPLNAVFAGVRFQSSNGAFSGAAADNFQLIQLTGTAPPTASIVVAPNGAVQINFTGVLQFSATVDGDFNNVPGNPASPYIIPPTSPLFGQFFRASN